MDRRALCADHREGQGWRYLNIGGSQKNMVEAWSEPGVVTRGVWHNSP